MVGGLVGGLIGVLVGGLSFGLVGGLVGGLECWRRGVPQAFRPPSPAGPQWVRPLELRQVPGLCRRADPAPQGGRRLRLRSSDAAGVLLRSIHRGHESEGHDRHSLSHRHEIVSCQSAFRHWEIIGVSSFFGEKRTDTNNCGLKSGWAPKNVSSSTLNRTIFSK